MFVSCRYGLPSRLVVRPRSAVRNCHLKDAPPEVSHPKDNPPRVSFPKIYSQRQPTEGLLSENLLSEATLRRSTVRGPDRKEDTPRRHAAPDTRGGVVPGKPRAAECASIFSKLRFFPQNRASRTRYFVHRPFINLITSHLNFQHRYGSVASHVPAPEPRQCRFEAVPKPSRRAYGPNRLSSSIFRGFRSALRPRSSQNPLPDRRKSLPGLVFHADFSYICF